jgi:hypothetical protein
MKSPKQPYKRSIWNHDTRYDFPMSGLSPQDLATVSRLMSVDAAKKRVPPIPPAQLLQISTLAKGLSKASTATQTEFESFLAKRHQFFGAGIAVLICMLSVESGGDYPPMDRKFAAGLRARGKITDEQLSALVGSDDREFAKVYISCVIPAWHESRSSRSPKEADDYWGSSA